MFRSFFGSASCFPGRGKTLDRAGLLALVTARGLACTGSFAKTTAQARHGAAKRAAETC